MSAVQGVFFVVEKSDLGWGRGGEKGSGQGGRNQEGSGGDGGWGICEWRRGCWRRQWGGV